MALNYSISLLKNPLKPMLPAKAYAKAQVMQEMSLKTLSRKVAAACTCTRADVTAVLISTVEQMIEALRDGMQVELGDLGKFRLQVESKGALSMDDFTSDYIKSVRIQFVPGEDLSTLFTGMEFARVPSRAAVKELLKKKQEAEKAAELNQE